LTAAGEQFTVTFAVRNSTGISAITANFNYDSSKLELVSSAAESGFALTLGTKLVVDHTEVKTGNFNIAKVTFKAKTAFVIGESTQVGISNVVGSDGTADVSAAGSSVTIKMEAPKSTNNYLSSLSINQGTINFNKTTTSYTVIVNNDITSITLSATVEDPKATVSGTGTKNFKVYSNVFQHCCNRRKWCQKTYSVNVVRRDADGNAGALSTNNNLSSLSVEGCAISFVDSQLEYRCEVDNLTTKVDITAKTADSKATFSIANIEELKVGDNVITVTVTSESGAVKVYTVVDKIENRPNPHQGKQMRFLTVLFLLYNMLKMTCTGHETVALYLILVLGNRANVVAYGDHTSIIQYRMQVAIDSGLSDGPDVLLYGSRYQVCRCDCMTLGRSHRD
jgi:hypothetical protein